MEVEKKNNSDVNNLRISTNSSGNNKCKSETQEQKKNWTSYMKHYRNNKRATKMNQKYKCNNKKQTSTTKENNNAESQKEKNEKIQTMAALIMRFHDIVSQGPLYICSCCDQLWYTVNTRI